ncbi:MAG: hypothetical protein JNN15_18005 [Blastocatellia bacterium]|nr:hypothetical protein [Blastocatellia bacterium]
MKRAITNFKPCRIFLLMVLFVTNFVVVKSQSQTSIAENERRIKSRDYASEVRNKIVDSRSKGTKLNLKSSYKAKNPNELVASSGVDIGITFWAITTERITRRKKADNNPKVIALAPQPFNISNGINNGDEFRFTLETHVLGNIYIINREQYKDGSFSAPYLIFPTKGDINDRTAPGERILIPNTSDVFEVSSISSFDSSKIKTAEFYHILITPKLLPNLPLLDSQEPREISQTEFDEFQKWDSQVGVFETNYYSKLKPPKQNSETMKRSDPLPQTIYHTAKKPGEPIFFTIVAQIKK